MNVPSPNNAGLEPFIAPKAKYLILGSFPSLKSLKQGFYYAHPSNRFFKLLAACFQEEEPKSVEDRKDFLLRHQISLFDVIKSCKRDGSKDSTIEDIVVNDLTPLFSPNIKIGCTGRASYDLFKRTYEREAIYLPSPSGLNQQKDLLKAYLDFFS